MSNMPWYEVTSIVRYGWLREERCTRVSRNFWWTIIQGPAEDSGTGNNLPRKFIPSKIHPLENSRAAITAEV